MNEIEAYIRQAALSNGIDPDVAVAVARSEGGLNDPTRQSDVVSRGRREPSYGPFQLLIGGNGFPEGLGNRALAAGIDPRDPDQWRQGVDFALAEAQRKGWGQWYGAANTGIDRWEGINQEAKPVGQFNLPPTDPLGVFGEPGAADPKQATPSPGGPVEAAGGGAGNEAGQAVQTPYTPPPAAKEPKNWWEVFGEGIADAAGAMGKSQSPGYNVPAQPGPARVDVAAAPFVDPQRAEMQRQQLAMALARLNQGRLYG